MPSLASARRPHGLSLSSPQASRSACPATVPLVALIDVLRDAGPAGLSSAVPEAAKRTLYRPTIAGCGAVAPTIVAHSGETDHPFRWQTDHPFRRKPITCRSEATRGRNHESRFSVRVDGRVRFRIESPFRSSLYALCTRRSRIALASVGAPMTSCHLRLPPISRTG